MSLLIKPPVVPAATRTVRTHELRQGSEVVGRDGTTTVVSEVHGSGKRIGLRFTDGHAAGYRAARRWRVIDPLGHARWSAVPPLPTRRYTRP